jgi:hypothetical protein
MKPIVTILILLLATNTGFAQSEDLKVKESKRGVEHMKLKITVGDEIVMATAYDNPTSRDFISLLPLTLTLKDYHSTEKISDLPKKLSTKGAPAGHDPSIGDITYYAPWGNLALFYKDFGYSSGLIAIAKIDSGMKAFNVSNSVNVKIELVSHD